MMADDGEGVLSVQPEGPPVVLLHGEDDGQPLREDAFEEAAAEALLAVGGLDAEAEEVDEASLLTEEGVGVEGIAEHDPLPRGELLLELVGAEGVVEEQHLHDRQPVEVGLLGGSDHGATIGRRRPRAGTVLEGIMTVRVLVEGAEGQALEALVDADIAAFETWEQGRGNEKLSRPEAAILKTYLWFKVKEEKASPPPPSASLL